MIAGQKAVRRSSWRRNETMTGWMFALPAILGFLILTLIPVSYTHLDVYKRQRLYRRETPD